MRMTATLPLLALALGACQAFGSTYGPVPFPKPVLYPAPPPLNGQSLPGYRAIGTEPFWDLTIGRDMIFTDRGNDARPVTEPTPPARSGVAGETYQGRRLQVNVIHTRCSDGMSDRTYPDTVTVTVDGRPYRGCGATAAFFVGLDERGVRRGVFDLANSNWRVVSINGQPMPPSGYYFNFAPDRLSGRFGCNMISGGYTVSGSTLRTGPLVMTQMGCPEPNYETQGTRIMGMPMTLIESGDRLTLSNARGTIELDRAR